MMTNKILKNPEYFEIKDDKSCSVYCGCNQEWYARKWQRMAGCGPTTASNIVIYCNKVKHIDKGSAISIMNEMWDHVTPTLRGVNTTKIFYEGFLSYADSNGRKADFEVLDVPKDAANRPSYEKVIDFIKGSLEEDIPIAFLNLCNGEECRLDKWHWVTLISLSLEKDKIFHAQILDEGMIKTIDLDLWYRTTTLGGGFVSFSMI